ncbi:hypothetical protein [Kordiimonas aestuarii]|uniref:hypothetical protein n=1 Tax=Kordiimonas aestuarii TaxID=1005925 RepID=UPI0021D08D39|nr:hypothetical protein [Kordiimonas aestuarii]
MRQTLVSGDVRAKEIAALVAEVKQRQLWLEGRFSVPCPDGCAGCAPCRKGYYQTDCGTMLDNIPGANRDRWDAWAALDREVRAVGQAMQAFSRNYNVKVAVEAIWSAVDILKAVTGRRPEDIAQAAGSAYTLIRRVFTYNDEFAAEFEREFATKLITLDTLRNRAVGLDSDFWRLIRAYQGDKCSPSLTPAHFNRP